MNQHEHRRKALKTLSTKPARAGLRGVTKFQLKTDILHLVIGLSTEMSELLLCYQPYFSGHQLAEIDKTNAVEEFGDLLYYANTLSQRLKVKMPRYGVKAKANPWHGKRWTDILISLNTEVGNLLDQCKKVFYGKEMNLDEMRVIHTNIMTILDAACAITGEKPGVIMEANIAKLAKRYPEGFFDTNAQAARDKAAEASTVEAAMEGTAESA